MVSASELNIQQEILNLSTRVKAALKGTADHSAAGDPHPQYSLESETTTTIHFRPGQWLLMPAAPTLLYGDATHIVRLNNQPYTTVEWQVNVATAGAANSALQLVYGLGFSGTPGDYLALPPSGSSLVIDSTGLKYTGLLDIDLGAATEIYLGIRGSGGDGIASPVFGQITVLLRG